MSHWKKYHSHWGIVEAPLRPTIDVVKKFRSIISNPGKVILLGVTPEIADEFSNIVAVDSNLEMIHGLWRGDTSTKKAICKDWLDLLEFRNSGVVGIVGDGSLNAFPKLSLIEKVVQDIYEILEPQGHFACRLFERPTRPFLFEDLDLFINKKVGTNFHAFKWMFAMHLSEELGPSIAVSEILSEFNAYYPNRHDLSLKSGWDLNSINTIDIYEGSTEVYTFPNRSEITALLPKNAENITFDYVGGYPLANCCPILHFMK